MLITQEVSQSTSYVTTSHLWPLYIQVSVEIHSILEAIKQQRLAGSTSAHSRAAVWSLFAERRLRPLVIGFIILHTAQQVVV